MRTKRIRKGPLFVYTNAEFIKYFLAGAECGD